MRLRGQPRICTRLTCLTMPHRTSVCHTGLSHSTRLHKSSSICTHHTHHTHQWAVAGCAAAAAGVYLPTLLETDKRPLRPSILTRCSLVACKQVEQARPRLPSTVERASAKLHHGVVRKLVQQQQCCMKGPRHGRAHAGAYLDLPHGAASRTCAGGPCTLSCALLHAKAPYQVEHATSEPHPCVRQGRINDTQAGVEVQGARMHGEKGEKVTLHSPDRRVEQVGPGSRVQQQLCCTVA